MEYSVWRNNTVAERSTIADKQPQAATMKNDVAVMDLALGMERPQTNNKREEASDKLSDRYLIGQAIKNPFLVENDYLQDLEVQHNFLMPKKTN
jgi:hypothetical protein